MRWLKYKQIAGLVELGKQFWDEVCVKSYVYVVSKTMVFMATITSKPISKAND